MPSWELWELIGWRRLLLLRWSEIWRWWTQSSSVEIDAGLLVDPLVGLGTLRDS